MKVVFISNYFNHHQKPFSDAMYKLTGENYWFIATDYISEERLNMGWQNLTADYVIQYQQEKEKCDNLILTAEVVIYGCAPYDIIRPRLKAGKLTYKYSERIHKSGYNYLKLVKHIPQFYWQYGRFRNLYCLCASAFTSFDFSKSLTFLNKCFKWGYFPELKQYDIDELMDYKRPDTILWVARFIDLKHPEIPILIAERLKKEGYKFNLTMVGNGELLESIKNNVAKTQLEDCVTFTGAISPEQVRNLMEESQIFMFTSDRNEGWGAVLNESMNSGCVVVGSSEIGSVPFLIDDGKNGLIYKDGDIDDCYRKIKFVLENPKRARAMGINAYKIIIDEWSAEVAAERLLNLSATILAGGNKFLLKSGPCSKAKILMDGWKNK